LHKPANQSAAAAGYKVYASEGAHSTFAPRGDLQRQIQAYIEERFGYCEGTISNYQVLICCRTHAQGQVLTTDKPTACFAVSGPSSSPALHSLYTW